MVLCVADIAKSKQLSYAEAMSLFHNRSVGWQESQIKKYTPFAVASSMFPKEEHE